eukprot:907640-Rhodomonas_salina.1
MDAVPRFSLAVLLCLAAARAPKLVPPLLRQLDGQGRRALHPPACRGLRSPKLQTHKPTNTADTKQTLTACVCSVESTHAPIQIRWCGMWEGSGGDGI